MALLVPVCMSKAIEESLIKNINFPVGNALRNNPFSPRVPCHRVIASNLFVGGFFGEWGKDDKTGTRFNQKVSMLSQEGVHFDSNGYLKASDRVLLKPGNLVKACRLPKW